MVVRASDFEVPTLDELDTLIDRTEKSIGIEPDAVREHYLRIIVMLARSARENLVDSNRHRDRAYERSQKIKKYLKKLERSRRRDGDIAGL